jgi:hypothetical protein
MKETSDTRAKLAVLETALDEATERWRAAKLAVRNAKEDAKLAKKLRKRARKALIKAQEEAHPPKAEGKEAHEMSAGLRASRGQIADSPEPRVKSKKRRKVVRPKVESGSDKQITLEKSTTSSQTEPSIEHGTHTAMPDTSE